MTKLYLEEVSMQKVSICRIKKTVEKNDENMMVQQVSIFYR